MHIVIFLLFCSCLFSFLFFFTFRHKIISFTCPVGAADIAAQFTYLQPFPNRKQMEGNMFQIHTQMMQTQQGGLKPHTICV
jgi:hypothetical protein